MINHQQPPNWVAEHAPQCDLDLTFEALAQIVKRDVEEINNLPLEKRQGYSFALKYNGKGTCPLLRVSRFPEIPFYKRDDLCVTFMKSPEAIEICCVDGDPLLAYPKWDKSASSCKLYVKGQDGNYELWELSKMALKPLFFGTDN